MMKLEKTYNNPKYVHILRNKKDFIEFFPEFVHRGWMSVKDNSFDAFVTFLTKYGSIVIKPKDGMQGDGVRKYVFSGQSDDELHRLFDELTAQDALIEECLKQHPDMVFGSMSLNTIRAMTLCRPDGKARVMKALLRAGVGNTFVDNYAMGGSIYEVDLKTGVIISYGKTKSGDKHMVHPQTDIMMLGYQIPKWDQAMDMVVRAAEKLPQVGFIGWDVAITPDNVQLIEGNNSADYELYEYLGTSGYYEKIKNFLAGKE